LEGGGEPTAVPEFPRWLKELRRAGVKDITLSTNAVALADPALCRVAAAGADWFTVNFPSHRPEVYARLTRSVKYPQAVQGLLNLKAAGAEGRLRFFHIISAGNYRLLPEFAGWAARNFPEAALVNFTFVRNKGRAETAHGIVPRYEQAMPYLKTALAALRLRGVKAVAQNVPLCQLGDFAGYSFELHRWRRGDKVCEDGVDAPAPCRACARCRLAPACCGLRADYARVHGDVELKASRRDPAKIEAEPF
jgi:MoaA/NifB/PqqE/SkfB family radical SAM enzyme